jgi:hypothetical protein
MSETEFARAEKLSLELFYLKKELEEFHKLKDEVVRLKGELFENSEEWRLPSEADPRANETCRNDFDQLDLTPGQSEIFSLLESGKYDDQSDVAFVLGVDPSVIFAQTWQVRNKIKKQKEEKKLLAKKKQLLDKGLEINWVKLSIV